MEITELETTVYSSWNYSWSIHSSDIEMMMMFVHLFSTSDWAALRLQLDSSIYDKLRLAAMPEYQEEQIQEMREFLSELIEQMLDPIQQFSSAFPLYQEVQELLPYCHLELIDDGASGSYFLIDQDGKTQFVVKPMDEGIFSLNNPKGLSSFRTDVRVRDSIPPYHTAETDMMAYLVAKEVGIPEVTPEAVIMMLDLDGFYDISQYRDVEPPADPEKLCSVQKFIPGGIALFECLQYLQAEGLSDEEIAEQFDQDNYEMVMLFMWLTYDTDGHGGNFLAIPKSDGKFKIMKIDNSLSFPEKHTEYRNILRYFENGKQAFSDKAKGIIANIPSHKIIEQLKVLNMNYAISPFMERVELLKELAQQEGITIEMVDKAIDEVNYEETTTSWGMSTSSPVRQLACG